MISIVSGMDGSLTSIFWKRRTGAVLLEVLAVFLVGRRADAAQRAGSKRRLQKVRRIHGAAESRPRR